MNSNQEHSENVVSQNVGNKENIRGGGRGRRPQNKQPFKQRERREPDMPTDGPSTSVVTDETRGNRENLPVSAPGSSAESGQRGRGRGGNRGRGSRRPPPANISDPSGSRVAEKPHSLVNMNVAPDEGFHFNANAVPFVPGLPATTMPTRHADGSHRRPPPAVRRQNSDDVRSQQNIPKENNHPDRTREMDPERQQRNPNSRRGGRGGKPARPRNDSAVDGQNAPNLRENRHPSTRGGNRSDGGRGQGRGGHRYSNMHRSIQQSHGVNVSSNGMTEPRRRVARIYSHDDDKPLRERIIEQLEEDNYDCCICFQKITARQGVWSCKKCYHIFHISGSCITNWAKKQKADDPDNKWRCPMCQSQYDLIPYNYVCFCGKERNPPTRFGDVAHSCGQTCGGVRGPGCVHPCNELCHPGPCAECPLQVPRRCRCGKTEKVVRCGSEIVVKCELICEKYLSCGNHKCQQVCHVGPCNECDVEVKQACFCGSEEKDVRCGEEGAYSCGTKCSGFYACGKHQCEMQCHARKGDDCGPCPSAPERVSHCPCGKQSLRELDIVRTACEDPIPSCGEICNKLLQCGGKREIDKHRCRSVCHAGPCPPCELTTSITCRCRQSQRTLSCVEFLPFAGGEEYLCERRCKKKKSCGIHKCQELCCVQKEHICVQLCNKKLSCGQHNCDHICHAGQCPRCLNASFDEQFCACGKTVRMPPIACGTLPPVCDEPCSRRHECGHVTHKCHPNPNCPPCTELCEKWCFGKHELRSNIPCHLPGISCGRLCDKALDCGVHKCNKNCHGEDCLRPGEKCKRPCPVLRSCEHPCALPCHGKSECPESLCNYQMDVSCECGRKKLKMKCVEVKKMQARMRAIEAESKVEDAIHQAQAPSSSPTRISPISELGSVLQRSSSMENLNFVACDDECKKLARNKRLAKALDIATDSDGFTLNEPTITYSDYLKMELKTNHQFVIEMEKVFVSLIEQLNDAAYCSSVATFNFKPMSLERRRFLHEYGQFFNIETVSVDDPPKRSVIASARRGFSRSPLVLLSSLTKYPGALSTPGPVTLRSNLEEEQKQKEVAAALAVETEGMRKLRAERKAMKRVAKVTEVAKPKPIAVRNAFDLLDSDVEEEMRRVEEEKRRAAAENAKKDWWDDEAKQDADATNPDADAAIGQKSNDAANEVAESVAALQLVDVDPESAAVQKNDAATEIPKISSAALLEQLFEEERERIPLEEGGSWEDAV